jgi:cytochrome oxidase Cu insertion factor (SCO1/SenC/PrrC family)
LRLIPTHTAINLPDTDMPDARTDPASQAASQAERQLRARNLRTIAALAGLFLLPLLASFVLYYGLHWRPAGMSNHGELVDPAQPLPAVTLIGADGATLSTSDAFTRHWNLVYVGAGACDDECRQTLYFMRQTWLSLNKDMLRVQREFLTTGGEVDRDFLRTEHADLKVLDASGPQAQALLAAFPEDARKRTLFIVDPLGNLMMRYDSRQTPRGLLDDLRKLLQLSHIG